MALVGGGGSGAGVNLTTSGAVGIVDVTITNPGSGYTTTPGIALGGVAGGSGQGLTLVPGTSNVTVQLTLYNFMSMYNTSYNLLFMNILLITIPPLIVFLFFNRQIVAGMTAGAVKG